MDTVTDLETGNSIRPVWINTTSRSVQKTNAVAQVVGKAAQSRPERHTVAVAATRLKEDRQAIYVARIDELRRLQDNATDPGNALDSHPPQFAAFFMMVFVFGQVMSQWALFSGHYAAWVAGLIFSLMGISIALASLMVLLNDRRQAIFDLIRQQSPENPAGPDTPKSRRSAHREHAGTDSINASA